jgi:hypothetical protein
MLRRKAVPAHSARQREEFGAMCAFLCSRHAGTHRDRTADGRWRPIRGRSDLQPMVWIVGCGQPSSAATNAAD